MLVKVIQVNAIIIFPFLQTPGVVLPYSCDLGKDRLQDLGDSSRRAGEANSFRASEQTQYISFRFLQHANSDVRILGRCPSI